MNNIAKRLEAYLTDMPIVAIIRGVTPDEVVGVGEALVRAGIKVIEVPLNSPSAIDSIARLTDAIGEISITGAGTVLTPEDVDKVAGAGGSIIVTPNIDVAVIKRAVASGLIPLPGFATATEAFTAYQAGARYLKLFPASTYGVDHIKALRAVLPSDMQLFAVGGAGAGNADIWFKAGANGLGVGSEIYMPGDDAQKVYEKARRLTDAIKAIRP